jgi:hypothetical protein
LNEGARLDSLHVPLVCLVVTSILLASLGGQAVTDALIVVHRPISWNLPPRPHILALNWLHGDVVERRKQLVLDAVL